MKGALFAILVIAGCATTTSNTPANTAPGAQTANGDDVVCSEVQKPGSMLTHTECRTRQQADTERDDARRMLSGPKAARDYGSTMSPGSNASPSGR